MNIEIKNRFTGNILISGEYDSLKDCLKKNRGAALGGADLRGAYLGGAYLGGAYLRGADLRGAYLGGAYLRGACLRGADLRGADLGDACLRGANGYVNSYDFFAEIVRRQAVAVFTEAEWNAIAQIIIHRLCWDSIRSLFSTVMPHIFQILVEAGFDEWLKRWNEISKAPSLQESLPRARNIEEIELLEGRQLNEPKS